MKFTARYWLYVSAFFIVLLIILPSCNKSSDPVVNAQVSEVDSFIWNGLRQYYLWVDDIPELNASNYANDEALANFLNSYGGNHDDLFYDLLYQYGTIDKWSWLVDDYVALENLLQGITTSMGIEYGLVKLNSVDDDIFGYIQYVVPDSPASQAGLVRGEVFHEIDGQQLTTSNYQSLLAQDNFTLSFANLNGASLVSNGKSVQLTATVVNEDPIHYYEIIDLQGSKVAYLVYNGFTSTYDHDLNDLFGTFKAEGVQELILDLRYNGGGSIRTATYLASMIYENNPSNIFSKNVYNAELTDYLLSEPDADSYFNNYFYQQIQEANGNPATDINSLNLDRLYVLTTSGTASASEMLINGLRPYLSSVILVGTNTHGKYVGSITVKDYYTTNGQLNPNHSWAMQPIILKTANSNNVSDFVDGFTPDYTVYHDYADILPFGNQNDPFLKAALDHIKGLTPSITKSVEIYDPFATSKDLRPFANEMYFDKEIKLK